MDDTLKKTPLYDAHVRAGARMVPFGGWNMPVQYTSIVDEHRAVRSSVGLFDVSHMGEFEVEGPGALFGLCNWGRPPTTSHALADGQIQYSLLCYPERRHRRRRHRVSPRAHRSLHGHRQRLQHREGPRVGHARTRPRAARGARAIVYGETGLIAVQGPQAPEALAADLRGPRRRPLGVLPPHVQGAVAGEPTPDRAHRLHGRGRASSSPRAASSTERLWDALMERAARTASSRSDSARATRCGWRCATALRQRHRRVHASDRGGPRLGREARQGRLRRARRDREVRAGRSAAPADRDPDGPTARSRVTATRSCTTAATLGHRDVGHVGPSVEALDRASRTWRRRWRRSARRST